MSEERFAPDPWSTLSQEFEITGARVFATLRIGREIILETVARLVCSEGRLYTFKFLPDGERHTLEYNFGFGVPEAAGTIPLTATPARILISGRYNDGCYVEIDGVGWIGHDGEGNLVGRFDTPPAIIAQDEEVGTRYGDEDGRKPGCIIIDFPKRPASATGRQPSRH
jgi:hypothetical protein